MATHERPLPATPLEKVGDMVLGFFASKLIGQGERTAADSPDADDDDPDAEPAAQSSPPPHDYLNDPRVSKLQVQDLRHFLLDEVEQKPLWDLGFVGAASEIEAIPTKLALLLYAERMAIPLAPLFDNLPSYVTDPRAHQLPWAALKAAVGDSGRVPLSDIEACGPDKARILVLAEENGVRLDGLLASVPEQCVDPQTPPARKGLPSPTLTLTPLPSSFAASPTSGGPPLSSRRPPRASGVLVSRRAERLSRVSSKGTTSKSRESVSKLSGKVNFSTIKKADLVEMERAARERQRAKEQSAAALARRAENEAAKAKVVEEAKAAAAVRMREAKEAARVEELRALGAAIARALVVEALADKAADDRAAEARQRVREQEALAMAAREEAARQAEVVAKQAATEQEARRDAVAAAYSHTICEAALARLEEEQLVVQAAEAAAAALAVRAKQLEEVKVTRKEQKALAERNLLELRSASAAELAQTAAFSITKRGAVQLQRVAAGQPREFTAASTGGSEGQRYIESSDRSVRGIMEADLAAAAQARLAVLTEAKLAQERVAKQEEERAREAEEAKKEAAKRFSTKLSDGLRRAEEEEVEASKELARQVAHTLVHEAVRLAPIIRRKEAQQRKLEEALEVHSSFEGARLASKLVDQAVRDATEEREAAEAEAARVAREAAEEEEERRSVEEAAKRAAEEEEAAIELARVEKEQRLEAVARAKEEEDRRAQERLEEERRQRATEIELTVKGSIRDRKALVRTLEKKLRAGDAQVRVPATSVRIPLTCTCLSHAPTSHMHMHVGRCALRSSCQPAASIRRSSRRVLPRAR